MRRTKDPAIADQADRFGDEGGVGVSDRDYTWVPAPDLHSRAVLSADVYHVGCFG